jgi:hypothetical protein
MQDSRLIATLQFMRYYARATDPRIRLPAQLGTYNPLSVEQLVLRHNLIDVVGDMRVLHR